MDDLQATVEIAVDLGRFYNVDLFQRGFYQVAVKLTEPAHPQAKLEVHVLKTNDKDHFCPARVIDDGLGAVSQCLQVLYKREECQLNHTFLFRVHCLLDSQKIMECLKKFNFQLEATLCFSSADDLPEDLTKCMEEVSKRTLKLELDLIYGLYSNTLVLFDYGYMAAVEVTIHASLVALHQPLMTMPGVLPSGSKTPGGAEPATLESILFRALPGMSLGQAISFDVKMSNAVTVHAKLIKILLTVYAHMQNYYLGLLRTLPKRHREGYVLSNLQQVSSRMYDREFQPDIDSLAIDAVDVTEKLKDMTIALRDLHSLEEVVNQVNMNLASTCSLLLALWSHVLDTSCLNKQVRKQLALKYHKNRVQRFQSGFFTTENPRSSQFDENRYGIYNWMASEMRSSRYFIELPVLPIHNEEADGTIDTLPIIFEDVYTHQCKKAPSFRSRSALGLFSRVPSPSASAVSSHSQNGFLNVTEEIGREEKFLSSPNSSVSSCGEVCETTVIVNGNDGSTSQKKRKYSSIFRKRKGSYKPRTERLSVSDDESTKVTLAEFLSSIENKEPTSSVRSKSFVAPSTTTSTRPKSSQTRRKLKISLSANDTKQRKSKKRSSFSQHRRSLDEGAQRLLQLVRLGKRSSDGVDEIVDDKNLSRSLSSSVLDQSKSESSSTASSHTSLDAFDDITVKDNAVVDSGSSKQNSATAKSYSVQSFAAAARSSENRFRAQIRSETSEEPESGISEKPVAISARSAVMSNKMHITVTATPVSKAPVKAPPLPSMPVQSSTVESPMHNLKPEQIFHGMIKSQSYSTGIERLQNGEDPNQYPRPHTNVMNSFPCGPHSKLKTSQTIFGGLDRVRYGMGLHPGGSTMTTTDLSPFDEPELIQAWGELTTSSPLQNSADADISPVTSDDSNSAMNNSFQQSDDDTLTHLDQSTPTAVQPEQTDTNLATSEGYAESAAPLEDSKVNSKILNGSVATVEDKVDSSDVVITENGFDDHTLGRVGALFFPELKDDDIFDDSVQGSTLPQDETLLKVQRSQSLRVFTGSLDCSEEPPDLELMRNLYPDQEEDFKNMIFEPSLGLYHADTTKTNTNNFTQVSATTSAASSTVSKFSDSKPAISVNNHNLAKQNPKKHLQLAAKEANSSFIGSVEFFNAVPPLRTQRERRHFAEKSRIFGHLHFPGFSYTDIPPVVPLSPYLSQRLSVTRGSSDIEGCHLIVCVHGLDGNSNDLRLVRTYIELATPATSTIKFLMSRANQDDTYADIDTMTDRLVTEIFDYIHLNFSSGRLPAKISFIGHSLGCLLIRSTVAHDRMRHLRPRFHTFLSFSGPHLGTIFNNSALVNTGLWLIQKWKKSACLLQLACKDHADMRKTFIYKLSKKKGLEFFRNILLVASASDRYVPYHSARIEMCKQAFRDKTLGPPYQEMLSNIMKPVLSKPKLNLIRYHVVHALPTATANTMIGRAAHIAVLDSEVFLEKFLLVAGMRHFV